MDILIYNIELAIRAFESSVDIPAWVSEQDLCNAIRDVMHGNPDIFWFSHYCLNYNNKTSISLHYKYDVECCLAIQQKITDIVKHNFNLDYVRKLSVREQVMYVYKWIALYCNYDLHAAHNHTIYNVFICRRAECIGISKATQYLLNQLEIDSQLVFGKMRYNGPETINHYWLIVCVEGNWYHLDPAFATPESYKILKDCGENIIEEHENLFYNFFCVNTHAIEISRSIYDWQNLPSCESCIDYHQLLDVIVDTSRDNTEIRHNGFRQKSYSEEVTEQTKNELELLQKNMDTCLENYEKSKMERKRLSNLLSEIKRVVQPLENADEDIKRIQEEMDSHSLKYEELKKLKQQLVEFASGHSCMLIPVKDNDEKIKCVQKEMDDHLRIYEYLKQQQSEQIQKFERSIRPLQDTQNKLRYIEEKIDEFLVNYADIRRQYAELMQETGTYGPDSLRENTKKEHTSFWNKFLLKKNKPKSVLSSVFAPSEVAPNRHMIVQVYLHLPEESEQVKKLAFEGDKNTERRAYEPLEVKLKKGDKVDIELCINGHNLLYNDRKSLVWQGSTIKRSFDYIVPDILDLYELSCSIIIIVNDAIVGEMIFLTNIVDSPRSSNTNIFSRPIKKLFISYSHKDLETAEKIAKIYEAMDIDVFFDKHRLKSGYIFSEEIFNYIKASDTFVLCWSENAAQSDYVKKEICAALERAYPNQQPREKAQISIKPYNIEPYSPAPDMISHYHFEKL